MKQTKWANRKFTPAEKKARAMWRQALKEKSEIVQALKSCDHYMTREDMHKRLDRRLDAIKRRQVKATETFPEVGESFTVATDTIVF